MNRNYQPLSTKVNEEVIKKFKQKFAIKKFYLHISWPVVLISTCALELFAVIIVFNLELSLQPSLVILLVPVVLTLVVGIFSAAQLSIWTNYICLFSFADANGLEYIPKTDEPDYAGMIFGIGSNCYAYDQLFNKTKKPFFEIANYRYTIGSDDNKRTIDYGYIIIQLDRNLPHMVLDSTSNNSKIFGMNLSNLPVSFKKDQRLSLEGDFDKHFTLYAPEDYKRDALYIFTPDLMALFIDESGSYDAEIIDNKLYIYSSSSFNLLNAKEMKRIFEIIDKIGAKTLSQTDKYADESVGNRSSDIVAMPGRRLKKRFGWIIIIFLIFIAIIMVKTMFEIFN